MNTKIKTSLILALGVVFMSSCAKDKEDPTITITSPENHSEHHEGSDVAIKAIFEDDKELASYKIEVGDESGEHIHEFHFFDEKTDLEGEKFEYSNTLTFPDSLTLNAYYLHFEVKDAEGKTATSKVMLHKH